MGRMTISHAPHRGQSDPSRPPQTIRPPRPKKPCGGEASSVYAAHPIRTCLWPRVSRWASGQEAGQPPGVGGRMEGDGYPLKSRLPVPPKGIVLRTATGSRRRNRRTPNLHGGRSLKQRRNGLFLVSLVLQRPAPKRLVLHCRACGVFPSDGYQSPDVSFGDPWRFQRAVDRPTDSGRLHVASAPLAPEGDASHDRAHP